MDVPNIVQAAPAGGQTGTFSATLRQTRIGLAADGPPLAAARTSGVVAMDFFGGIPGFQTGQVMPLPRLIVGFARIETDRLAFQAGQDHVILAPRDPVVAGRRSPSRRCSDRATCTCARRRRASKRRSRPGVRLTAGILAPVGGDLPGENYRFVPPALGGERSRHPALQAHLGYSSDPDVDAPRRVAVGVSGHFGRERRRAPRRELGRGRGLCRAARCDRGGRRIVHRKEHRRVRGRHRARRARVRRLGRAAVLSDEPADRVGGRGLDRLRGPVFSLPRRESRSAYGTLRYALTPEIEAAVEYHRLATRPGTGAERRATITSTGSCCTGSDDGAHRNPAGSSRAGCSGVAMAAVPAAAAGRAGFRNRANDDAAGHHACVRRDVCRADRRDRAAAAGAGLDHAAQQDVPAAGARRARRLDGEPSRTRTRSSTTCSRSRAPSHSTWASTARVTRATARSRGRARTACSATSTPR
jgi:hypothetical protein